MTWTGWLQIVVFLAIVLAVTPPVGRYLTWVFSEERTALDRIFGPAERLLYRLTRVDADRRMDWREYAGSVLCFSGVTMLTLYALMRLQRWLPLNPQGLGPVAPDLAFNAA